MAVTASVPSGASLYSTTAGDSYATSSWTAPGAVRNYICFTQCVGASLRTGTVSGNGLTWTEIGTFRAFDTEASPTRRIQAFRARGTATTGATTVDYGAGTDMTGGVIVVVEIDGSTDTGTVGQGVEQLVKNSADSGTAESVTLAAFANANNAMLCFFLQDTNSVPTEDGTYTELSSGTFTAPNTGAVVAFLASNDTSVTATGSNNSWGGIALELIAATGDQTVDGATLSTTPTLPTASVNHTLTGVTLSATPTLPTGRVDLTVHGAALSVTPTLPAGTVNTDGGQTVTGVTLSVTPTLPTGRVDLSVHGVTLSVTPTLPQASVNHTLTGVTLSTVPTLPAGSVNRTVTGVTLTTTPTLPAGRVDKSVHGVTLTVTPTFPQGSVVAAQTVTGVTLVITPSLPQGSVFTVVPGVHDITVTLTSSHRVTMAQLVLHRVEVATQASHKVRNTVEPS